MWKQKLIAVVQMRVFWKLVAIGLAGVGVYVSPELVDGVAVLVDAAL